MTELLLPNYCFQGQNSFLKTTVLKDRIPFWKPLFSSSEFLLPYYCFHGRNFFYLSTVFNDRISFSELLFSRTEFFLRLMTPLLPFDPRTHLSGPRIKLTSDWAWLCLDWRQTNIWSCPDYDSNTARSPW